LFLPRPCPRLFFIVRVKSSHLSLTVVSPPPLIFIPEGTVCHVFPETSDTRPSPPLLWRARESFDLCSLRFFFRPVPPATSSTHPFSFFRPRRLPPLLFLLFPLRICCRTQEASVSLAELIDFHDSDFSSSPFPLALDLLHGPTKPPDFLTRALYSLSLMQCRNHLFSHDPPLLRTPAIAPIFATRPGLLQDFRFRRRPSMVPPFCRKPTQTSRFPVRHLLFALTGTKRPPLSPSTRTRIHSKAFDYPTLVPPLTPVVRSRPLQEVREA